MNHPNIHAEFRAGKFVVHITNDNFLGMAIDRCHEQDNGAVKASDGAVGHSATPTALRGRTVTDPEVARYIAAFKENQVAG